MRIVKIETYQVKLPLRTPFVTSYGILNEKEFDILLLTDELGNVGFGELLALKAPDYIEECLMTARLVLKNFLVPLLTVKNIEHPNELGKIFGNVKGNYMAKAALETAVWDLYAKRHKKSLKDIFKVDKTSLAVGISLGIEKDLDKLLEQVDRSIQQGYQRIKLKIRPNYDLEPISVVRSAYPAISLIVDANSAYSISDISKLKKLDDFNLDLIEQPFASDDFLQHAQLQQMLNTKICLDENIRSLGDCQLAVALGSCKSINLKIPRVGGISEALKIMEYCHEQDLLIWLGGMYESGVGRALNLQFAAQAEFNFPGDISASSRYFYEDIINESLELDNGLLPIPTGLGIGVSLSFDNLEKYGSYVCLYKSF